MRLLRSGEAAEGETIALPTLAALASDWYTQNRYKNVTTPQFIALAEAESGRDLDAFFQAWLYTPQKPTSW